MKLWDARTGRPLASLGGHEWGVKALAFTPDGRSLISGGDAGRLRAWDVDAALADGPATRTQ